MILRIDHETRLTYSEPVTESVIKVRMAPPSNEDQTALNVRLQTGPPVPVSGYRDGFGNRVDVFNVFPPHREVVIAVTSFVRTHRRPAVDRLGDAPPPTQLEQLDLYEFLQPSALVRGGEAVSDFVAGLPRPDGRLVEVLPALWRAVHDRMKYEKKVTDAQTDVESALRLGRGVCQDFSHLYLAACRGVGLPARYVSGYIHQPGEIATHAWCQVWAGDGVGWIDVDPTRAGWVNDDYVSTAVGRDYNDVPPNRGVWKGNASESIAVTVKVNPVDRLPAELTDGMAPAWFGASYGSDPGRNRPPRLHMQRFIRQQQSQQQQ